MIWGWLLLALVTVLNALFSWLPHVSALPLGIDEALTTAFGYWYGFLAVFWPFSIVWTMVLWYYGMKVTLLGLKFIFGHRIH